MAVTWKKVTFDDNVPNIGNTNLTIPAAALRRLEFADSDTNFAVKNSSNRAIFYLQHNTVQLGNATNDSSGTSTVNLFAKAGSFVLEPTTATLTTETFQIVSADDGSDSKPVIDIFRNSASPTDNDEIGEVRFTGEDSIGIQTTYATIEGVINQESQAGEKGSLKISVTSAAALTEAFTVGAGGNSPVTTSKTADEHKLDAISVYGKSLLNLASRSVAMYQYGENADFENTKGGGDLEIYMRAANGVRLGPGNNLNLSEDNYLGTVMHRDGFITGGSMNYHIKAITDSSVDYVATLKVLVINNNGANYTVDLCEFNDNAGASGTTRNTDLVRTGQARTTVAGANCEFFEAGDRLVPFVVLDVDGGNTNSHSVTLEDFVVNVEVLFEDTTAS